MEHFDKRLQISAMPTDKSETTASQNNTKINLTDNSDVNMIFHKIKAGDAERR